MSSIRSTIEELEQLEDVMEQVKRGKIPCDKKSKKKPKVCCACGRKNHIMMSVKTAMVVGDVEKKEKWRWYCPDCMKVVKWELDRFQGLRN